MQSREAFGVLFAIFFIVIAPGIMSRVVAHNTLPELSPEEGEFISIISWNINYGWSSDGKMNIHDIAERVAQQQAGVVALQDANALQWPLGSKRPDRLPVDTPHHAPAQRPVHIDSW